MGEEGRIETYGICVCGIIFIVHFQVKTIRFFALALALALPIPLQKFLERLVSIPPTRIYPLATAILGLFKILQSDSKSRKYKWLITYPFPARNTRRVYGYVDLGRRINVLHRGER
jgi:hypothetical protein